MKKCGLKRAYAQGGVLPDQMQNIGSDNPINAEREARWRMDDVQNAMKYAQTEGQYRGLGKLLNQQASAYDQQFVNPPPVRKPAPQPLLGQEAQQEMSAIQTYQKQLGFRQGGMVGVDQRGFIEGPGGVDNVPARIDETGEEIRVGAGERIVNKKQNAALEALAAQAGMSLDEYLEASTQEPVGPTMKKGLRAAQSGGRFMGPMPLLDDEVRSRAAQMQAQRAATRAFPTQQAAPPPQAASGQGGFGGKIARVGGAMAMVAAPLRALASDEPTVAGKLREGTGLAPALTQDEAMFAPGKGGINFRSVADPYAQRQRAEAASRIQSGMTQEQIGLNNQHAANMVQGNGTGKFTMPAIDKAAGRSATAAALANADPQTDAGMRAGNIAGAAQTARANDLDYANLEQGAKSVRSDFMGEMDATAYQLPPGAEGGFITRRNNGGLRNTTYLSGAPSAADAARDKEFAAKGYAKDAYGNWMTPQRMADKQALAQIQRERAEFNAFSDQVTDPNARRAGLRAMVLNYGPADKRAAEVAKQRADQALALRAQDITLRGQDNMQGNADREFALKVGEANAKDVDKWMDTMAPTAGLKDEALAAAQHKRSVLQQVMGNHWGGNVPQDRQSFLKAQPQMAREAQATMRLYDVLGQQGFWDWVRNNGTSPARTMQALSPKRYDQDSDMLTLADGYKVKGKEIWGNDADMRAAITGRIK